MSITLDGTIGITANSITAQIATSNSAVLQTVTANSVVAQTVTTNTVTVNSAVVQTMTVNSAVVQVMTANGSVGNTNQALYANSSGGIYWSIVPTWQYISSNTTLTAGSYLVDASTQSNINLTLPASPANGTTITMQDANNSWGNGLPVVLNNGQTIMGSSSPLTLDTPNAKFTLWYNGSDWRLV